MSVDQGIEATDKWFGRFRCTTATHPGIRRSVNEDALLSRPDLGLWAVADGAGGHRRGRAAARAVVTALDAIAPGLNASELLTAVRAQLSGAHQLLREEAARTGDGLMATTIVVLVVRDGHFACLWAGDSRAYLMRDGMVDQLTVDHSVVQQLLERGTIDAAEADAHPDANVITRAVGAGEQEPELDKIMGPVVAGDRFLLCSDGMCKILPAETLAACLCDGDVAEAMVAATLTRMPTDNVTVVTVDFLHDERPGLTG